MFGFVKPFVPELKVKEHEYYRSIYCGLCRSMRKHTGGTSALTLSYDMVFFALVRLALGDDHHIVLRRRRCFLHPFRRRSMADDRAEISYTARISALLAKAKCEDGIRDEKGAKRLFYKTAKRFLRRSCRKADLKEAEEAVAVSMRSLWALEDEKCPSPDRAADEFGKLLALLGSGGLDGARAATAKEIFLHVGRFVYLIDAASDYSDDVKKGRYNPFIYAFDGQKQASAFFAEELGKLLTLELSAAEKALDLIDTSEVPMTEACIRNILRFGMTAEITKMEKQSKEEPR